MAPSLLQRLANAIPVVQQSTDYSSHTYPAEKDVEHNAESTATSVQPNTMSDSQPSARFLKFQNLTGIQSTRTVTKGRPVPNPGIYSTCGDLVSLVHIRPWLKAGPRRSRGAFVTCHQNDCSHDVTKADRPVVTERTADEESKVHFRYVLSTYTVNVFFLLQIVVGAALTALYVCSKLFLPL